MLTCYLDVDPGHDDHMLHVLINQLPHLIEVIVVYIHCTAFSVSS